MDCVKVGNEGWDEKHWKNLDELLGIGNEASEVRGLQWSDLLWGEQ